VKKDIKFKIIASALFVLLLLVSFISDFKPGIQISRNMLSFVRQMIFIIPCAFILIGLFEVWVKKEMVEKHLGCESSFMGYIWAILLATTTVGGLYVAFPVAYALQQKGASYRVIFTYIGASAVCRIPMTLFEISFVGLEFSVIRFIVSVPLVIISANVLSRYILKKDLKITMKER